MTKIVGVLGDEVEQQILEMTRVRFEVPAAVAIDALIAQEVLPDARLAERLEAEAVQASRPWST